MRSTKTCVLFFINVATNVIFLMRSVMAFCEFHFRCEQRYHVAMWLRLYILLFFSCVCIVGQNSLFLVATLPQS